MERTKKKLSWFDDRLSFNLQSRLIQLENLNNTDIICIFNNECVQKEISSFSFHLIVCIFLKMSTIEFQSPIVVCK